MGATFPLAVQLLLKDNLTPGWGKMERELRSRGTSLMAQAKKYSLFVTAPLTAMAALSAKATDNYYGYLARFQRATGESKGDVERFGAELRKQAVRDGLEFDSLADVASKAAGEFKNLATAQKLIKPTMDLARASATDAGEAFSSLNGILEVYDKHAERVPEVADILARASAAAGEGSLPEMAKAIRKVGQLAKERNISLERVAETIVRNEEKSPTLSTLAKSLAARLRSGDTRDFRPGTNILDRQRPLSEQIESDFLGGSKAAKRFKAAWHDILLGFGESGIYDGLTTLLQLGTKALTLLSSMPDWMQTGVVGFGALAAAIGPVAYGLGFLMKNFSHVKALLFTLPAAFRMVAVGFRAMSALLKANPWGLLIAGLVAGAVLVIENWEAVKEFFGGLWKWVKEAFEGSLAWIMEKVAAVGSFFGFDGDRVAGGGAAAAAIAAPVAVMEPLSISAAPAQAEITLNVRGLPKGTTVSTRGDADIRTNLGTTMSHVPGSR